MSAPFEGIELIDPEYYAHAGYPHEIWRRLRREQPVHWFDRSPGEQFWAITRHEDIVAISKQPELFISGPTLSVHPTPLSDRPHIPKNLIQFDPPDHGPQRKLISKRFTPRALQRFHVQIERIARGVVDELFERGDEGECDFVEQISAPLPIAVIGWLLGVPQPDWPRLFDWTNRQVGSSDAEYQDDGATRAETMERAVAELFDYFTHLLAERRREPREDLISLFAHAEVDGRRLTDDEVLIWCNLIVVAGNETTRNATTGGMLALIENPHALRRLQSDPGLLGSAIEEILRWTTPVIHFARTATRDTEIRGQKIRRGEVVAMFYGSANRDEDVFEAPFEFRIDRRPNRHLAFGVGEHFCAGAHVARLEMEYAFRFLLPRIESVELAGTLERLRSNVIGGYKRLPIRYKLRARS